MVILFISMPIVDFLLTLGSITQVLHLDKLMLVGYHDAMHALLGLLFEIRRVELIIIIAMIVITMCMLLERIVVLICIERQATARIVVSLVSTIATAVVL